MNGHAPLGKDDIQTVAKRLEDARLRVDLAGNFRLEVERDIQAGLIPALHAETAYKHALLQQHLAIQHHQRVLNTLTFLRRNLEDGQGNGNGNPTADDGNDPSSISNP